MTDLRANPAGVRAFSVMAKPIGPVCNLDCTYCFYLEKEKLFDGHRRFQMSDEVLREFIRQHIEGQDVPVVGFAWQGGEPTLAGLEFFHRVVELQATFADGRQISNAIQTNGTLLDDEWCAFLTEHQFLVGVSIDGPARLHDLYRVDKRKRPTFDAVMRGLELLKKHETEFNTLTVVNRSNAAEPLAVYRFLKEVGSGFMQFIPLVEREPDAAAKAMGMGLATPPQPAPENGEGPPVTTWSVGPDQFGSFLVDIFDEWVRKDVGRFFVQTFDVALANWVGAPPGLCTFAATCGTGMALEHDGNLYSCDHYVYPRFKIGNVLDASIAEVVNSDRQLRFGSDKLTTLTLSCRECEVRFACHGECPRLRFASSSDGELGLNYLCRGYRRFFHHVDPYMRQMAHLLARGLPAAGVMDLY
ncbi:MAG: anaerobic sulfatase maturase [Acidimicrobiales bacterium]|jgi:uncharacterized protein|nr:anaerobic sulfatase maturase [Acidimicrobiales bacterium]MDP7118248.1 anaerobic sulfatase maturase [Acidimicrobiales bacterium]|tara:strand:+ start:1210 stop:2454 length:1245 start_codon:yes stop_codon:yes gene_type:complete